jgi:hypothetical protein
MQPSLYIHCVPFTVWAVRIKWGGRGLELERLPSMHEGQGSIPTTAKIK